MKIKVRLLKDWTNDGTEWKSGQLLNVDEAGAASMVKDGIAEIYEPKEGDVIVASDASGDTGLNEEAIAKIIAKAFDENNKNLKLAHDKLPPNEKALAETGHYRTIGDFAADIFKAGRGSASISEKLQEWDTFTKAASGLGEMVDADGGFLIPTEFRNQLMKDALGASITIPRSTVIPMSTNTVKIPVVNESTRATSVYGGIIIYRPSEGVQKTATAPKFGQVTLTLHKLVGLCYVSDELIEDSAVSLAPLLSTMFSEAIAFQQDNDHINGTGANQALGVLNAPATILQAKETDQAAVSIVTENIFKMEARLKSRSWRNAVWFASQNTLPSLRTLVINVGTGGAVIPLFNKTGDSMTLDGFPLIITEHCAAVGTEGDIILGDWRQYLVGQKAAGLQVATSIHLRFDYDEQAFRFVMRSDGQPWEISARTPKNGGDTLGSFVKLAVRE